MVKMRNAYKIFVRKTEGERPLERHGHRKKDNIRIHLQEIMFDVDWIQLAQDTDHCLTLVNTVMNLQVP
jgi:hypothetical protein